MRFLYFILKLILPYPIRIYYPRIKKVNAPKKFFSRTIFVSNHASSFMDPLVPAVLQRPIVFFMTRSDVFKNWLQPLLWSVQMLPIYREQDGEDTKARNKEVFETCNRILKHKRSLLIYGEGFTDDTFIRRLKPIKKGAVRIGFGALEALNWEEKIYIAALGINYADPKVMGSDVLISNSDPICLNDYRIAYLENPAKTVAELTKVIEHDLQQQLTHVEDKNWAPFHENVCRLLRNGMNVRDTNFSIPLKKRWENSRRLALWMNERDLNEDAELVQLKADMEAYFELQKQEQISEKIVYARAKTGKLRTSFEWLLLCCFLPLVPIGLIQFFIPYIAVKRFTEKSFKRPVFWSSVKMFLGVVSMTLWNIPIVLLLNHFLFHSGLVALTYFLICPIIGMITYEWFVIRKTWLKKRRLKKYDFSELLRKREDLLVDIKRLVLRGG